MTDIEPPSTSLIAAAAKAWPMRLHYRAAQVLALLGIFSASATAQTAASSWRLTWSDEFNGSNGSSPDPARWTFDLGGSGHGNHELETYTSHPANARQQGGNLVLTAIREDATGKDGIPRHYTSARIKTQGLFAQAYGRFEARIQLPLGKGIWPAFWMLGDNLDTTPWPACGEIDIFENIGEPSVSHSTVHGPGYSGAKGLSTKYSLPAGAAVNTAFHLYTLEWAPGDLKFFLDDHLVAERTPANLPAGARWVYDHPFFLILNLAVGVDWPGNPDASTTFPQQMLVDYVRVYTKSGTPPAKQEAR